MGIFSWLGMLTVIAPIIGGIWSIISGVKALKGKTKYKKSAIMGIILSISAWAFIIIAVVSTDSDTGADNDTKVENSEIVQEMEMSSSKETEFEQETLESQQMTTDVDNHKDGVNNTDDDLSEYEEILNSYDVSIRINASEGKMEKYRNDTSVYIDGEKIISKLGIGNGKGRVEFSDTLYVYATLEEGEHEIWLTKTTNNKERESNKIKFEVSPQYTNHLEIEADLIKKKEFELTTVVENNKLFDGYETERYNDVEIIRTSEGKQIYYTVEFLVDHTQFIGDSSIEDIEWLESVQVARGDTATPPEAPNINNYEFIGWSEDLDNVKSNLEVYAQYELREEDCYSEYLGKYEYKTKNYSNGQNEDYICTLEISKITNIGVYFSLNFIDKDSGDEIFVTDELAEWHTEGISAHWTYKEIGEFDEYNYEGNVKEYYLVLSLFERDGESRVSVIDSGGNTNAEDTLNEKYERVY